MSRTAVKVYLGPDLAAEIARIARAQGRSESSLIAEAVQARMATAAEGVSEAEVATQKRQLNRLEARVEKILCDQAVMKESLLLFVRVWLEHNPPIDDALEDSAAASADARFERFLDFVMQGLTPGRSVAKSVFSPARDTAEAGA